MDGKAGHCPNVLADARIRFSCRPLTCACRGPVWQPPGLQHAVHEIYVARQPRSQPHGVPDRPLAYDDMWARSTDLVLVPRTPSRLEYLQEAWRRGAEVGVVQLAARVRCPGEFAPS